MKKLSLIIWVLFLLGCTQSQFDREAMLNNITNTVIIPNHEQFVATTATLHESAQRFSVDDSAENLTNLQSAWHDASLAWMGCAPFEFDIVKEALIHNRIDNRPARAQFIEDTIAGGEPISAEFLANVGSSSQGLSAIEYLIFSNNLTDKRRVQYVVGAAELLHQNSEALLQVWVGGYAEAFASAEFEQGNVQEPLNMTVNAILEQIEMITWDRLGKPMGKRTGGIPRIDLVEAPISGSSIARIQATVDTLEQTYINGINDYLDYLEADYNGEQLSHVIADQFNTIQTALNAIAPPLSNSIEQNPAIVEAAYEELRTLITLIKVDAANQMGITLTFNDNDGD